MRCAQKFLETLNYFDEFGVFLSPFLAKIEKLDEIDKISGRDDRRGGDVSREGVQRDLLPLIEGTTVSTKHGMVKANHILFICSGAFHLSKPSDLLPELQARAFSARYSSSR